MFRTFTCPSSGVLIYWLFHCRMWCYAIGCGPAELVCSLVHCCQLVTKSAQDYTPTPKDHSLNTYGITPHAVVKQPIYKNS